MKQAPHLLLAAFLVIAAIARLPAQPTGPAAADSAWQSVKDLGRQGGASSDPVASQIQAADQLKAFYTNYPGHSEAKNAKCLEALALVGAWQAGDTSQEQRRNQAVASVRNDKAVDSALRAELFAFADSVAVEKTPGLSLENRLLAYEHATRALIAEFPSLANGYEALLHLAHDSSPTRAPTLAREVAGLGAAPAWVRTEAQVLVNRFSLPGQSLRQITATVTNPGNPIVTTAGRPVLVYSWTRGSTSSQLRAKALATGADPTAVVGVCLDSDVASARAQATAAGLPGDQIYDALGARGGVAGMLFLSEPGLIYRIDAAGIIQSVSAQNEPPPPSAGGLDVAATNPLPPKADPTKPAYPGILTSVDPNQPPPFPDSEKTAAGAPDAATAAIIPALRARVDAAHADWAKAKAVGFHPNLTYLGGYPVLMLMVASDESAAAQTYRLGAMVDACEFMLQDSAFDRSVFCLATYDAAHPEKMTTRNIEVKRDAFQRAVKNAGKSSAFATALATVRADDSAVAIRQVCTELNLP